jgi:tetratricopeptide (TPR) repeat protein
MSELTKNPRGILFSRTLTNLNYQFQGQIHKADKMGEESIRMIEATGDTFTKGALYAHHGTALYYKGLFDDAEKCILEGLPLCEKNSMVTYVGWASYHMGWMYFSMGEYKKAKEYFDKGVSLAEKNKQFSSWVIVGKASSAMAREYDNERDINISEIVESSKNIKLKVCEGWVERCIGHILLHMGGDHLTDAEIWIKNTIDASTRKGMRWWLAADHALYADWFKKKGDIQAAKEQLIKAIDLFRECGADGWVTITEEKLAGLM